MRFRVVLAGLLALCLLAGGCAGDPSFGQKVDRIAKPYSFSILGWELSAVGHEVLHPFEIGEDESHDYSLDSVAKYFALTGKVAGLQWQLTGIGAGMTQGDAGAVRAEIAELKAQAAELAGDVQTTIGTQIKRALAAEGIYVPFFKAKLNLPPLDFRLIDLPTLLVISPRDRIVSIKDLTLRPGLSDAERATIEKQVDALGVSSLVVDIGGMAGTFPTMVANIGDLEFTVKTIAHEWVHQYLAFHPLGFLYILSELNIRPDYEIATMNETVADMVSEEIAARVMAGYYPQYPTPQPPAPGAFDFNQAMRDIRRTVDDILSDGRVAEAEAYMEQQRDYLATHGYYIRKLNQAYFAFNGTYAASPTSISPIGAAFKELRRQSPSLKTFLAAAASLTGVRGLEAAVD